MVLLKDIFNEAKKKYPPHNGTKSSKKYNTKTTGFINVKKIACRDCKQGFTYTYITLSDDNKRKYISSVDFLQLKRKILDQGLPWGINNRVNALKTVKESGYSLYDLL